MLTHVLLMRPTLGEKYGVAIMFPSIDRTPYV